MKLSIVGRGVRPLEHLTLAGLRAIKSADVVFGIEPDTASWTKLAEEFDLPRIEPLDFLYRDGASDTENYEAFYSFIQDVTPLYENVVFVVAGHPRLGVSVAQWFTARGLPENVELEIIEGISSFDTMFNDLQVDPIERGTSILDANRLLLFKYNIEPSLDTFIYHPSSIGNTQTDYTNCHERNQVSLLMKYLMQFFPAHKEIFFCKASNFSGQKENYIKLKLNEMQDKSQFIDPGTSIYIPAEKPTRICRTFLSHLRSSHDTAQVHSL